MDETIFLGHTIKYWLELQNKATISNTTELIEEIATLRAKVSFYESRIEDMNRFKETVDKRSN